MDNGILAMGRQAGQAGAEKLEALAAGLREKHPGEAFLKELVRVSGIRWWNELRCADGVDAGVLLELTLNC